MAPRKRHRKKAAPSSRLPAGRRLPPRRPAGGTRKKPARSKFRNSTRIFEFRSKKTGRIISKKYAQKFPARAIKKAAYISKQTGKRISPRKMHWNPKIQALRELWRPIKKGRKTILSEKGARRQAKALREWSEADRAQLDGMGRNYQRWFKWLLEHEPDLIPENIAGYLRGEDDATREAELEGGEGWI